MMKCPNWFKSLLSIIIDYIPVAITALATGSIICALVVFHHTATSFPFKSKRDTVLVYHYAVAGLDSVTCFAQDTLKCISQSKVDDIEKRVAALEQEEHRFIDDLRDETNNQINMINIWVSLWLGIISFLGILLPLVYQLKQRKFDEKKIDDAINHLKESNQNGVNQLNADFEKLKKERIDKALSDIDSTKCQLDAKIKEYETSTRLSNLQNLVLNLSEIVDNRMSMENEGCEKLRPYIYKRSIDNFNYIVTQLFADENLQEENVYLVMRALVLIYELVSKHFIQSVSSRYNRKATAVRDDINKALNQAIRYKSVRKEELQDNFNELIRNLYGLAND